MTTKYNNTIIIIILYITSEGNRCSFQEEPTENQSSLPLGNGASFMKKELSNSLNINENITHPFPAPKKPPQGSKERASLAKDEFKIWRKGK